MTKDEMMDYVKAYILDGSKGWEETRYYIISHIDDFSEILEQHELDKVEFHCLLPFLKEIFLFAPDDIDDYERIDRAYNAVTECKSYYAPQMTKTPMVDFIEMIDDLFKRRYSSSEEGKQLNGKIEVLILAILFKSRDLLRGKMTI